jgi:hypothetical protein
MTNHGQTEEDTIDRDMRGNLVLADAVPFYSGQASDKRKYLKLDFNN